MATKKQTVNEKLAAVFAETPPANPALSHADKAYLLRLKNRGYTEDEIIQVAAKAGFKVTQELFVVKPKKTKANA